MNGKYLLLYLRFSKTFGPHFTLQKTFINTLKQNFLQQHIGLHERTNENLVLTISYVLFLFGDFLCCGSSSCGASSRVELPGFVARKRPVLAWQPAVGSHGNRGDGKFTPCGVTRG